MTGLVFLLQEGSVCVGMDTLTHTVEPDGSMRPLCFTSKIHLLPHAHAVLCGTGVADVVLRWYCLLEGRTVAIDLEVLDRLAVEHLPRIWAEEKQAWEDRGAPAPGTATIYQFGFLRREGRYAGFAYRSDRGFVSERLAYGVGIKPNYARVQELCARYLDEGHLDDGFVERLFVVLLRALKEEDERSEETARVGIGGEVHIVKMRDSRFELSVAGQFDDYEEDFESMRKSLSEKDESAKDPGVASVGD